MLCKVIRFPVVIIRQFQSTQRLMIRSSQFRSFIIFLRFHQFPPLHEDFSHRKARDLANQVEKCFRRLMFFFQLAYLVMNERTQQKILLNRNLEYGTNGIQIRVLFILKSASLLKAHLTGANGFFLSFGAFFARDVKISHISEMHHSCEITWYEYFP